MGDDIPYHIPGTFKVGNVARACRVVAAHAWHEEWSIKHDSFVGLRVKIIEADSIRGYFCEARVNSVLVERAWFPSAALSPMGTSADPVVISVPSVEAT